MHAEAVGKWEVSAKVCEAVASQVEDTWADFWPLTVSAALTVLSLDCGSVTFVASLVDLDEVAPMVVCVLPVDYESGTNVETLVGLGSYLGA